MKNCDVSYHFHIALNSDVFLILKMYSLSRRSLLIFMLPKGSDSPLLFLILEFYVEQNTKL